MANGRDRREPVFDAPAEEARGAGPRLSPEDRAGERWRGELLRTAAGRAAPPSRRTKRKSGRSLFSKLVYAGLVLCLWGVIGVGGVVAYYASQLPPIDQLTVPKRPPNIAILASDGSLLANRGETGGRTVTLKESALPAQGLRRHRGPALLRPFRHRPDRHRPRGLPQPEQQRRPAGRLDPDAAARQEPVPDPGAHRLAQDPGGDPGALARAQLLEGPDPRAYLNRVYFGAGAYGVEAAAQRYYGKSARSVSLSEAAVLAGLVQSPSRLAPNRNPERAQARAELVIAAMNEPASSRRA